MSSSMADQERESQREADGAREELHAILSARHELGTEYNDELADMLMERLDAVIDRRVEARLQDVSGSDMSPCRADLLVHIRDSGNSHCRLSYRLCWCGFRLGRSSPRQCALLR